VNLLWLGLGSGVMALVFAAVTTRRVLREDAGTERMRAIAALIQDGAGAFLRREYTFLAGFVVVVALVVAAFVDYDVTGRFADRGITPAGALTSWPRTAIAYVLGAVTSGASGYIGMYVAVRANVRTAAKARVGLNAALRVAFSSGVVMGMTVVGLSLVFICLIYLVFRHFQPLTGFAFGASSIALFARVGGGIYTKAADVGADLVGKVEAGIPEDDPRNPATIADNVGDNVGRTPAPSLRRCRWGPSAFREPPLMPCSRLAPTRPSTAPRSCCRSASQGSGRSAQSSARCSSARATTRRWGVCSGHCVQAYSVRQG
jgi:K(+)-stimulated pyrophosphate-energized sodium pump